MNVRKRAESSTPAMPSTRAGTRDALLRDVAHRVEQVGDDDQDRVRRVAHRLLDDGPDDPGVLGEQVVAAHARLAGAAGGDDDDVGAGGVRVVVRSDHAASCPTTGAASARSRPLPCGSPSTMSMRTTSAMPDSAMRWGVAPTLPAPMTVTLLRA